MLDLRFTEFQKKENQYIDADEFFSLKKQGYTIPENVIVVPVSLSESPDLFNKIVRLKQVMPNTSIDLITNVVKSKLSPGTVILNTSKLNQYFPSASGVKIIDDINNGVPLSAETAKFLIDKNIIMSESDNYDIDTAWNDVLEFFGLSEKQTVRDEPVLVPNEPEVVETEAVVEPEVVETEAVTDKVTDKTAAKASGKKGKLKYRKTIAGKALQALVRPVAVSKSKKAPKTVVGKMLRPIAAAKAADAPKTVVGKMLRPIKAAKAAAPPKTVAGKILRPISALKAKKAAKKAKKAADKAVNSITMAVQKNEPVSELKIAKANEAAIKEERTAANAEILANAAPDELVTVTNVKTGEPIPMMSIE